MVWVTQRKVENLFFLQAGPISFSKVVFCFSKFGFYKSPKLVFFMFGAKKVHNSIDSLIMFDDEGNVQYYR